MIIGRKVRFRAIEEADLPALAGWLNDPQIAHLVGGFSFPVSMGEQRRWFEDMQSDGKTQRWIVEALSGERLGLTGLWDIDWQNRHALTSLKLGTDGIRGKGYGTDAIMTLMSYAFYQLGLNRLWSEILPFNAGSYRAYVNHCGWKVEGVNRQHIYRDGRFYDQLRVACLKEDFDRHPQAADYRPTLDPNSIDVCPEDIAMAWPSRPKAEAET